MAPAKSKTDQAASAEAEQASTFDSPAPLGAAQASEQTETRRPRRSKKDIAVADYEYAKRKFTKKLDRLVQIDAERDPLKAEVDELKADMDYRAANPLLRDYFEANGGQPDALTGTALPGRPVKDAPQA